MRKSLKWLARGGAFASLLLLFQNCGNQQFDSSDQSELSSLIGAQGDSSSTSEGGSSSSSSSSGSGGISNSPPSFTTNNQFPSNNTTSNTTTTQPNTQPAPTSSGGCAQHYQYMGWNGDPNQVITIEFNPFDSYDTSGAKEIYTYGGFQIWLTSTPKAGVKSSEAYYQTLPAATSGLKIRLTDLQTKKSVELTSADFGASSTTTANVSGFSNARFNSSSRQTSSGVSVKRDFFEKHKASLGYTQVDLICEGKLIATGVQDFQSLTVPLSKKMTKTASGGYTYTGDFAEVGSARLTCPSEAAAGSTVSCSVAGTYIVSESYEINYKKDSKYDDLAQINIPNLPKGIHLVQAKVIYKNGMEDRSLMRTIRIK